ncbi:saccharopine dehydrogenase family protein [Desulfatibacillum aliphaticivorans]|uniref:saccharopine dehydrogenase family protein n=1 Tax=Desulfatibacillum aliphaticivorans TaxID=218208 RepID=UPI0003FC66D6|nr:saccharopine dehydrogenase NADP-binding domain-containing protein [Desulfatibacillum aliphaticivorans]
MAKAVVLGGCGAVGTVASKTLAGQDLFSQVILADQNRERAESLIGEWGSDKVGFVQTDALDPESIKAAIQGADVVVNCVGPFYKSVKIILDAVLESGINYVDVCDDVDVTLDILNWDKKAKEAGVSACIGMGSSPGATNLLAKFAADALLDEVESIDIFHAHGGEPFEGPGVIGHRFHCMSIDIPMFLDGELKYVKYFEEDGIALRQTFDFPVLGGDVLLYPYPHPEQVTLPRYIKTRQVTNKGTVLPSEYYDLTRDMCRLGLSGKESLDVNGQSVVPYDFALAYIIRERERILKETRFGSQRGCCSVVVKGRKEDAYSEYRFHMASGSQALGEGTGVPAAVGAMLMVLGKITEKGVLPPEGCINPQDFLDLVSPVMKLDEKKGDSDSFSGVIVQHVDALGKVSTLDI